MLSCLNGPNRPTMRRLAKFAPIFLFAASCWISVGAAVPPDQATVQAIYRKLCAAAGLLQGAPVLEFDNASARASGAFTDFNHEPTRIVVERKALEVCATFGGRTNDAVAFLLGHELAHFSMGHGWGADFQRIGDHSQVKADMALAFANNKAYHLFETQADQRGAFYAYIAGYVPELVADTLLQRLYSTYGWNPKMSGYPDLPDREGQLRSGLDHYQELTMALRLADHRSILGQYGEAAKLYELLLSEGFRNPMLFTNTGACYLLQAIALGPAGSIAYTYPVELDLRDKWRGAGDGITKEELLRKAEDLFLQALLMDRTSEAALADLACVAFLRNDLGSAGHWIAQHGKIAAMNQRTHLILEAILQARNGDLPKAKGTLNDPLLKSSWIAKRNLQAIDGKVPAPTPVAPWGDATMEKIDGKSLSDLSTGFTDAPHLDYRTSTILRYRLAWDHWKMAADRIDAAQKTHWLYLCGTLSGYAGTSSKGIGLTDPIEQVTKAYGQPDRTLQTMDGELDLYLQHGILFHLDRDHRVSGWTLFAEKQQ